MHCRRRRCRGGYQLPVRMRAAGRRPRGIPAPAGGHCPCGMHPPFLFCLAKRETGRTRRGYAASVSGRAANGCAIARSKEKSVWRAPAPSCLRADGSRRIGASADFALPSGTLSSSAIPVTAVPWRMVRRLSGWLSHCLCFSFRCRWPGGQRELVQRADVGIGPYGDAEDAEGHPFFRGCGGYERSLTFCGDTESHRFSGKPRAIVFVGMWKAICFF